MEVTFRVSFDMGSLSDGSVGKPREPVTVASPPQASAKPTGTEPTDSDSMNRPKCIFTRPAAGYQRLQAVWCAGLSATSSMSASPPGRRLHVDCPPLLSHDQ